MCAWPPSDGQQNSKQIPLIILDGLTEEEKDHNDAQNILQFLYTILFPGAEDDDKSAEKRRKLSLPYWLVIIIYYFIPS